jgi:hypothetical protein
MSRPASAAARASPAPSGASIWAGPIGRAPAAGREGAGGPGEGSVELTGTTPLVVLRADAPFQCGRMPNASRHAPDTPPPTSDQPG